jgi:hypothetical protein
MYLNIATFSKGFISSLHIVICSCIPLTEHKHIFIFSALTSILTYLLVTCALLNSRLFMFSRNRTSSVWTRNCESIQFQFILFLLGWSSYILQIPVPTSQWTQTVFITNTKKLSLFLKIIALYCENQKKHTNTLCGKTARILNVAYIVTIVIEGTEHTQ